MYTDPSGEIFVWLMLGVLLFTPVGGITTQVAVSAACYVGMTIGALFDEQIKADMSSIGWNPFNNNAHAVIGSGKVSFFKCVPVFRTDLDRSGSFGAIFLNGGANVDDLNHERGHNSQLMRMGIGTYGFSVGIPSPLALGNYGGYYNSPWETMADILGGVQGRKHTQSEIANAGYYYFLSTACLPLTAFYGV